jgi:hypothetical protein
MKTCLKCKETKPYTEFNKQSTAKDSHFSYCRPCNKTYRQTNYKENKEHILNRTRKWQNSNKERDKSNKSKYKKLIYKLPQQRKTIICGQIIRNALKRGGDRICKLIGCSPNFLKRRFESLFSPGMSWGNYGFGKDKWTVDHIQPLSSFNLVDPEEYKKANHFTNLQPLWLVSNIKKRNSRNDLTPSYHN